MMEGMKDYDDPSDDCTHWAGQLPKAHLHCAECAAERDARRLQQPDIQCKELPVEEGQSHEHREAD
jgi:hypothetical protein